MDFGAGGREGNLATQLNWVPSIHQHYRTDNYKASVGILKMILDSCKLKGMGVGVRINSTTVISFIMLLHLW